MVKLTPSEIQTVQSAANAVWQYIGGDLLQAVAESEDKDINHVLIPRDEVVEVVIDADRLHAHMKERKLLTPAIATLFEFEHNTQLTRVVTKGFAFTRYGM